MGTRTYHELHDVEWLEDHADVPMNQIAKSVGCTPAWVSQCYAKYGVDHDFQHARGPEYRRSDALWRSWEIELLRALYGRVPAWWIAQRLGRTEDAIHVARAKFILDALTEGRGAWWLEFRQQPEIRWWIAWQATISAALPVWQTKLTNDEFQEVLGLEWRPQVDHPVGGCRRCHHRRQCEALPWGCLCEPVTVGEALTQARIS